MNAPDKIFDLEEKKATPMEEGMGVWIFYTSSKNFKSLFKSFKILKRSIKIHTAIPPSVGVPFLRIALEFYDKSSK